LLQTQVCNLDQPSSRVLKTFRSFFTKPNPIITGKAKYMLDDSKDLVALHPRSSTQQLPELHLRLVVAIISTLVAVVLLIGAITSLCFVNRSGAKLGMRAGFTTLFAASVGLLTSAKRQEISAASAAYAAILVVFVSGNLEDG
ncbi:uncharacterized protein BDR25DRAFT_220410, partial [Lindgomyces ingoldianus]